MRLAGTVVAPYKEDTNEAFLHFLSVLPVAYALDWYISRNIWRATNTGGALLPVPKL